MTRLIPRSLPLDGAGLLRDGASEFPNQAQAYTVFAQQRDARIDAAAWARHASRFFDAEVCLTRPKVYGETPPQTDAAHLVLTPKRFSEIGRAHV